MCSSVDGRIERNQMSPTENNGIFKGKTVASIHGLAHGIDLLNKRIDRLEDNCASKGSLKTLWTAFLTYVTISFMALVTLFKN